MATSILKQKADKLAYRGYDLTNKFPKEELYCLTSQIRRALLSIPANIIEGYARNRSKAFLNHLEISYGSLSEVKYFMNFACRRKYITKEEYMDFYKDAEEVSKIIWASISTIYKNLNSANREDDLH
jgi:four helix bundle protein